METYELKDLSRVQDYILGGRADFIISDRNIDLHINFKVNIDSKDKNKYYVKYKSADWIYIGMINTKTIEIENVLLNYPLFSLSKKSLTKDQIDKGSIFSILIKYLYYIQTIPRNIQFLYTGRCSICGRKLTDPEYIKIGMGPTCLENNKI